MNGDVDPSSQQRLLDLLHEHAPFADLAEQALRQGKNKIDPLFRDIEMRIVEEHELTRQNFSPDMFRNLNTLEELKQASKH